MKQIAFFWVLNLVTVAVVSQNAITVGNDGKSWNVITYQSFYKLLKENNIKFIKWDMNKVMTDPGFPSAPSDEQRAVRIKYVENLYRLVESLRREFPDVWFENCSSGADELIWR